MFTTEQFDTFFIVKYGMAKRTLSLYRKQGKLPTGRKVGCYRYFTGYEIKKVEKRIKTKFYL